VSRLWWQGSAADIVKHAMIQLHRRLAPREPRRPRQPVLAAAAAVAAAADDGVAAVQEEDAAVAMMVDAGEKELAVVVVAEGDAAAAAAVEQEGRQPEEGEDDEEEDTIEGSLWATLRTGGRCRMVRSPTACSPALINFTGFTQYHRPSQASRVKRDGGHGNNAIHLVPGLSARCYRSTMSCCSRWTRSMRRMRCGASAPRWRRRAATTW
jgi:hypothetical protein